MRVGIVGDKDAVKEVLDELSEGLTNVVNEKNGVRGEINVVEEAGPSEILLCKGQKGVEAVLYCLTGKEDELEELKQQLSEMKKQPPFAIVGQIDLDEADEEFSESRFYLGGFSLDEHLDALLWSLYHVSEAPSHVLWNRPESTFTAVGWRAIHRLFWYHDRDVDDTLNDAELHSFLSAVMDGVCDISREVETTKAFIKEQQADLSIDNFTSNNNLTSYAILALVEDWLTDTDHPDYWKRTRGLWNALSASGIHKSGLAWCTADFDSVKLADQKTDMLQLSYNGVEFLKEVYTEKFSCPSKMWQFTPATQWTSAGEPPWADVPGLPGSRENPAEYTIDSFISSWKFITVRKYQHLIVFARVWGLQKDEDPNMLFVKKKKREFRKKETELPNILQCLILGSPKCGKTAVRKRLVNHELYATSADQHVATESHSITLVPQKSGDDNEIFDLVLHEIPDRSVPTLLNSPSFMSHIDAILLCYDGDDVYSFSYIAEKYPTLVKLKIPMLLVMTKMDLIGDDLHNLQDQEYTVQPHEFAQKAGLCWPPALISCTPPSASLKQINDIDDLPLSLSMLCRYPEEHIGRENSRLCCRVGKLLLLTTVLTSSVVGAVRLVKRR